MRIRALRVENWRSIRRLELADLAERVTVLHGPNGTGKSSLVAAIRACLLDIDYDSASAEIRAAVPVGTSASPEVAVEFEAADEVYRITKRFSPRKDGFALLERHTGSGWKTEIDESKEAGRRVRKILGAQSSNANWYRLLWLDQGEARLNPDGIADGDLRTAIINALGGLVTARDRAIEQALNQRAKQWLTPSGRLSSKSRLAELQKNKLPEAERRVNELREERRRLEGAIAQVEGLRRRIEQLKRQIAESEAECALLATRLEQLAPLQEKRAALETQLAAAQEKAQALSSRLQQWQELQTRHTDAMQTTLTLNTKLTEALKDYDARQAACETLSKQLQSAAAQVETLRARRAQLELQRQLAQADNVRREVNDLTARADELRTAIASSDTTAVMAPSESELKQLAARWRKLQAEEARLAATAVHVEFLPKQPGTVHATIDGQSVELTLSPDQPNSLNWHSEAELQIPGWGTIRLSRQAAEAAPQQAAAERDALQAEVARFDESLAKDDWLSRLSDRVYANEKATRDLVQLKTELKKLEAELARRQSTLIQADAAKADLIAQLSPAEGEQISATLEELSALETTLAADLKLHEQAANAAQREHAQAEKAWRAAEQDVNNLRRDLAVAENSREHFAKERAQHGGHEPSLATSDESAASAAQRDSDQAFARFESELQTQLAAAQANVAKYQAELNAINQPADGPRLAAQAKSANEKLDELRRQHQRAREEFSEMRGKIAASEGTHTQLAEAEHALEYLRGQMARDQVQVDAYRYLLELFSDCRHGDVAEMLEPVSKLVGRWAREVGMAEFNRVPLTREFSLDHVALSRAGGEHHLSLAQESYGAVEQLSLLVRLALGGVLAVEEPRLMLLDDPLVHADITRHKQTLQVMSAAAGGNNLGEPPTGPLQLLILTCHPERFAELPDAQTIDLAACGEFQSSPQALEITSELQTPTPKSAVPPPRRRRKTLPQGVVPKSAAAQTKPAAESSGQRGFWD